jgi:alkylation response protein AidB-like acyl-CoA dehydrogenase
MPMELTARTAAGRELVALAERFADAFGGRAAGHDRDGSYPFASHEDLLHAGWFAAAVPAELGGLGVGSVHDVIVASGRLARGDASLAIGVNMHHVVVLNIARRWRMARAAGNARREAAFAGSLREIAEGDVVLAAAMSEAGQDLTRPLTEAVRTPAGWRIDGHKIFCTMSPAATALLTSVRFADDRGAERYGYVEVPTSAPGVRINDDWDALGMRASGSHSVTFEGVELPASALRGGFPTGEPVPYLERNLPSGLFHASASLGIAEAAFLKATAKADRLAGDARARMLVAESAIDLASSRAVLGRAAALIDDYHEANPAADGGDDEITALFAEGQAAKTFVNEASTRVVDRALALSGGAGYVNGSPLARAYRDVRAGAFMHPLGANRAYDFLADVALGRPHALH